MDSPPRRGAGKRRELIHSFDEDVAWSLYDMDLAAAAEAIAEAGKPL